MNTEKQSLISQPLPWSWQQKLDDFIKPGDTVIDMADYPNGTQETESGTVDVLLSKNLPVNYAEAAALLKKDGFFICQQTGSEHCRTLAEYLAPNSRAATPLNLENEVLKMQAADFRVMFRAQAYPVTTVGSVGALLDFIAANPSFFPGFSQAQSQLKINALPLPIKFTQHHFILIGKLRHAGRAANSHPSEI